jgi:hypothetical protein
MNSCFLLLFIAAIPARGASWQQHPEVEQDYTKPKLIRGRTSYLALPKNDIDTDYKESITRVENDYDPHPVAPSQLPILRRLSIPPWGGQLIRTDSIVGVEAFEGSLPRNEEPQSPIIVSPTVNKVNKTPQIDWSDEDMQVDEIWR